MNTTDGAAPLLRVTLRGGSTLSISPDAVRLGEPPGQPPSVEEREGEPPAAAASETIALDRVQDARQIAPEPPTFALRIAGRRLLEFQPVEPGEGALALEAIYRLRPELRPAGFEPPVSVPDWWPSGPIVAPPGPGWVQASGSPLSSVPGASVGGSGYDAGYRTGFGPGAASRYDGASDGLPAYPEAPLGQARPGEPLAGRPRDLLGLVAAAFRLFRDHWRTWLLLGLIVSAPPAIVSGALQMAFYAVRGFNPWRGLDTSAAGLWPTRPPRAPQLAELVALLVALVVVEVLASAWQAAVLGVAGHEALSGEPVDLRASLERGVRRFVPVLLVSLAAYVAPLVAMGVPLALAAAVAPAVEGTSPSAAPDAAVLAAASVGCLSLVLFVALGIAGLYVITRLFVAPYLAATQPLDVREALVASWRLTGGSGPGRRLWLAPGWRALGVVLIVFVIEAIATSPLGSVELASYGLSSLVVDPLSACVTGPLTSLAFVVALRDLRLRASGANSTHHKP